MFKTKTEALILYIYILNRSPNSNLNIQSAINTLKHCVENHSYDALATIHSSMLDEPLISQEMKQKLSFILSELQRTDFTTVPIQEKFNNPFRRQLESFISIELLQKPTTKTMNAVGEISKSIATVLEQQDNLTVTQKETIHKDFLNSLYYLDPNTLPESDRYNNAIALGSFRETKTLEDVINILKENDPAKLPIIMNIHFKFALLLSRELPLIATPIHEPTGKFRDYLLYIHARMNNNLHDEIDINDHNQASSNEMALANYRQNLPETWYEFYFQDLAGNNEEAKKFLSDIIMYGSAYYKKYPSKGRLTSELNYNIDTNKLGIMRLDQADFEEDMPILDHYWTPDVKAMEPDLGNNDNSLVVKALLEHEAIYCSGPSGMATLLLQIMENMGNFTTIEEKQSYLTAITGFICAGGYHSFHEVLGPAAFFLDLVPGYQAAVIDPNKPSVCPKVGTYLEVMSRMDPEIAMLRDQAWNSTLTTKNIKALAELMEHNYVPLNLILICRRYQSSLEHSLLTIINNSPTAELQKLIDLFPSEDRQKLKKVKDKKLLAKSIYHLLMEHIHNKNIENLFSNHQANIPESIAHLIAKMSVLDKLLNETHLEDFKKLLSDNKALLASDEPVAKSAQTNRKNFFGFDLFGTKKTTKILHGFQVKMLLKKISYECPMIWLNHMKINRD